VKHLIVGLALAGSIVTTIVAQNADPQGPRRTAESPRRTADGVTPLLTAIYHGDVQAVDRLIAAGANVRAANREGVTPLAMACLDGDLPIIERLLAAGADPKARGPNGETLLMLAARNGRVDVLKRLLAAGADVNAREGLRGTTALMWAAEQRHPEAVKTLLAAEKLPHVTLTTGGVGSREPAVTGKAEIDLQKNRRVTLHVARAGG